MIGNKICFTQKGLDFIKNQQLFLPTSAISLPSVESTIFNQTNRQSHHQKKLSQLSTTLTKLQTIGIKKLSLKKQDEKLQKSLKKQIKHKYISTLVPAIVRRTRDGKVGNLHSRLNRGKQYAEKLLRTHSQHKGYGMLNYKKKSLNTQEKRN